MDSSNLEVKEFFKMQRGRRINSSDLKTKCNGILYWMSRDQRVHDNWALYYAQQLALQHCVPLFVCFCLVPKFLEATIRQYGFLLKGLMEVEKELKRLRIPFHLELGLASIRVPSFVKERNISAVVCDFSPLRVPLGWVTDTGKQLESLGVPLVQVDAHNIVPCWVTSDKAEYAARTIRGKIHAHLESYLVHIPPIVEHCYNKDVILKDTDWSVAERSLTIDRTIKEVSWAEPGYSAGLRMLDDFCGKRLKKYSTDRNNPNCDGLSNLSPWYHFGQLSVQRAILTIRKFSKQYSEGVSAYIEEAVVRRELSDNFCYYNKNYDSVKGAPQWAQESLRIHAKDKREYLYSQEEFENGETHDPLWNAAQMTREGKMHGYLRMYWAKKILEWTPSPEEALKTAIYLNDKYELDGRDPNGYVGCMWSICGIHDQGWKERPVFGKIRYMNYAGCKRKFNVEQFERKYLTSKRKKSLDEYIETKAGPSKKIKTN